MKVTLKINNQDIEAEIKDSDVTKIVEKPKKKIRPEVGEDYYVLYANSDALLYLWGDMGIDHERWDSGSGFFTEEEALKESAKRRAIQRIKDYIVEHDMEFCPDWNDKYQGKYYPFYDIRLRKVDWAYLSVSMGYLPFSYLGSRNHIIQLIKDCQDDLLIIFDKK